MGFRKKLIIAVSVVLSLFFWHAHPMPTFAASLDLINDDSQEAQDMLVENIKQKLKRGTYFVLGIESQLKNSSEELKILKHNINQLESKIDETNANASSLASQVENLDKLILQNQKKIEIVKLQIAEQENQILNLESDVKQGEDFLKKQIAYLDSALSTYYMQNNVFFSTGDNSPNLLAFMASPESTGDTIKQNEYLFFLQNASQDLSKKIMDAQRELDLKKDALQIQKNHLSQFQSLLATQNKNLADTQESKQRLLDETKGKQLIYETLLQMSKQEEEQVSLQITRLKENFDFFQTKLDELKNDPLASGINPADFMLGGEEMEPILKGSAPLAWPVSPALGLSALFHDSAYQKVMGIEHDAIDIRIPQGSEAKSAGDGVVTKVADNGFAYSYVIIAHPDKMLTLYGHLSDILVTEGEIVRQGQTIGLSGGIPGTKGAGWLTTGAHLHFEVYKNFQHVDPLEYLPLEFMPINFLPEKYLNKLSGNEELKIQRAQGP